MNSCWITHDHFWQSKTMPCILTNHTFNTDLLFEFKWEKSPSWRIHLYSYFCNLRVNLPITSSHRMYTNISEKRTTIWCVCVCVCVYIYIYIYIYIYTHTHTQRHMHSCLMALFGTSCLQSKQHEHLMIWAQDNTYNCQHASNGTVTFVGWMVYIYQSTLNQNTHTLDCRHQMNANVVKMRDMHIYIYTYIYIYIYIYITSCWTWKIYAPCLGVPIFFWKWLCSCVTWRIHISELAESIFRLNESLWYSKLHNNCQFFSTVFQNWIATINLQSSRVPATTVV